MTLPTSGSRADAAIPAFVNPAAGSAPAALAALRDDPRFALREVPPDRLADALRVAAREGARRVVVSGGDGTVATAAGVAADTGLELAILPGGTRNHFARNLGLPVHDVRACLEIAAAGVPRRADLGEVNGHRILNTSSVGIYVAFVRTREPLERWLGYWVASALAAVRAWLGVRDFEVEMRAIERPAADAPPDPSPARRYRTPLVFVSVGERDLTRHSPGARLPRGHRVLHAMVVRETTRARLAALAWSALRDGLDAVVRTDALDALLVDECVVRLRRPSGIVAVDGELVRLQAPLHYRILRDAFRVIGPPDGAG